MTLVSVKPWVGKNPFAKKEDGSPDEEAIREQFIWGFESDEQNEFNEPLEYGVWTNTNYGNPKASLTKFLNLLLARDFKGLSADERTDTMRHRGTDDLIGTRYAITLRELQSQKGTMFVGHTDIEPILDKKGKVQRVLVEAPKAEPVVSRAQASGFEVDREGVPM